MNRILTSTIALQSIVAAAVIAASPLAAAGNVTSAAVDPGRDHVLNFQPFVSAVSREQVRAEAVAAARQTLSVTDSQHAPVLAPLAYNVSRAQVHAEAVETVRLGLTGGYENQKRATPEQIEQIRMAGQRAAASDRVAAVNR